MEEKGSGFAFDGGVSGDDDFGNGVVFDSINEFTDVELFGGDAVNGADGAAKNVIGTGILVSLLNGVNIKRSFDD